MFIHIDGQMDTYRQGKRLNRGKYPIDDRGETPPLSGYWKQSSATDLVGGIATHK